MSCTRTSLLQWLTRVLFAPPPSPSPQGLNGVEEEKEVEAVEEVGAMPGHEKDCQCGKCRLIRAYLAMEEEREGDALV